MGVFYEFEEVEGFVAGAVGEPGQRVFYLQARHEGLTVSVRCEKQQVAALGEYLRRVLRDLPPASPGADVDLEFHSPGEPAFILGPIGLGYDRDIDRVLVQLEELDPDESDTPALDRGHLRVSITREQAIAFCDDAARVVEAGRPTCAWCDRPLDPAGHACARMN